MPSHPSRTLSATSQKDASGKAASGKTLEDNINLDMLMSLKRAFQLADKDAGGSLDIDEFVTAFEGVLGKKNEVSNETESLFNKDQLRRLFMKVDANSDGTIDWDEFSTYMLLENQGTSVMRDSETRYEYVEQDFPDACPDSLAHREPISNIKGPVLGDRYISAGRDGTVKLWNRHELSVYRSLRVGNAWVTDVAYLPRHHKIAVASHSRSMHLYDVSEKMELVGSLSDLEHVPMTLDTWTPENRGGDVLVQGDAGGYVQMMSLKEKAEDDMLNLYDRFVFTSIWKVKPHTDWVSRARYVSDLNAITSCSLDKLICLTDVERRMPTRTLAGHNKSVYAFDWSRQYKFIASCGMDRNILLWNPFSQKPMATLTGHLSSVQDVIINDTQIITLGVDKQIRIWDIRNHRCIQVLHDKTAYRPENKIGAILYDSDKKCLVTGTLKLKQWPLRAREESGGNAHMASISCALFNPDFMEAVSGDFGSVVCVWDVTTGAMRFKFARVHGTAKITAMGFDNMRRRLITGSSNGELKMWNFSNGSCLKTLVGNGDEEVTGIQYVQGGFHSKHIIGVGWNRKVTFWEDSDQAKEVPVSRRLVGHAEDITSTAMGSNSVLATGGYDGEILLWNIDSGATKMKLIPPSIARRASSAMERGWKDAIDDDHSECSVEGLVFLNTASHVLLALYADGCLRLWNSVDGTMFHEKETNHVKQESVVALCVANDDSNIVTGDSAGFIKVWVLDTAPLKSKAAAAAAKSAGVSLVSEQHFWRAHKSGVTALDWVNAEPGKREAMIMSGGSDCSVILWTAQGVRVGEFGVDSWNVYDISTWAASSMRPPTAQELEQPLPESYIQGPEEELGREPDEIATQLTKLPWMHRVTMQKEKKALLVPRSAKVYIPKSHKRINFPGVAGRNHGTLAHLLHISDMEKPAPRPKTRQWVTNVDSIHSSAEVMNMAMGQRPHTVPAGVGRPTFDRSSGAGTGMR